MIYLLNSKYIFPWVCSNQFSWWIIFNVRRGQANYRGYQLVPNMFVLTTHLRDTCRFPLSPKQKTIISSHLVLEGIGFWLINNTPALHAANTVKNHLKNVFKKWNWMKYIKLWLSGSGVQRVYLSGLLTINFNSIVWRYRPQLLANILAHLIVTQPGVKVISLNSKKISRLSFQTLWGFNLADQIPD